MSTRLFTKENLKPSGRILLDKSAHRYLAKVLRLRVGDPVRLFNGRDGEYSSNIKTLSTKHAVLHVNAQEKVQPKTSARQQMHLLFAPIKRERQFFLIEKATELGVSTLRPIKTQYTQHRTPPKERMIRKVIGALVQSERLTIPEIQPESSFDALLNNWTGGTILVGLARQAGVELKDILPQQTAPTFFIGPEGGFSPDEIETLQQHASVQTFSLGGAILRAETASLSCLVLCKSYKR